MLLVSSIIQQGCKRKRETSGSLPRGQMLQMPKMRNLFWASCHRRAVCSYQDCPSWWTILHTRKRRNGKLMRCLWWLVHEVEDYQFFFSLCLQVFVIECDCQKLFALTWIECRNKEEKENWSFYVNTHFENCTSKWNWWVLYSKCRLPSNAGRKETCKWAWFHT